jgi:hypothetical protein
MKIKITKIHTKEPIHSLGVATSLFSIPNGSSKIYTLKLVPELRAVLADNRVLIPMENIIEMSVEIEKEEVKVVVTPKEPKESKKA